MMKRYIASALVSICLLSLLAGCSSGYHADDFLGKTSAEIISKFGPFDCITMPVSEDGLFRNCRFGYTVKASQKGFPGTSPEILFFITFDENAVAVKCEEGYRPGG